MLMGKWNESKDGWLYSDDGTQRWRRRKDGTVECESVPVGESMTKQEFADDCDVNKILARFLKTGQMPPINTKSGVYGDFSEMPSYQEALNNVIRAESMFMEIPAEIRLRFNNDPQALIDYLADASNDDEAVKLGLKVRSTPPADPVVEKLAEISKKLDKADAK